MLYIDTSPYTLYSQVRGSGAGKVAHCGNLVVTASKRDMERKDKVVERNTFPAPQMMGKA